MILELIMSAVLFLLKTVFSLLPNIPQLSETLTNSIDRVFGVIFDNVGLLGLFVRISTIKWLVPLVVVVYNFEHIYHFIMWVIKKIPLSID